MDDEQQPTAAVLLFDVAVGKTPGEPAGSLVRVGLEYGHLVRRMQAVRRAGAVHGDSGGHLRRRGARFLERVFPTATDEGSALSRVSAGTPGLPPALCGPRLIRHQRDARSGRRSVVLAADLGRQGRQPERERPAGEQPVEAGRRRGPCLETRTARTRSAHARRTRAAWRGLRRVGRRALPGASGQRRPRRGAFGAPCSGGGCVGTSRRGSGRRRRTCPRCRRRGRCGRPLPAGQWSPAGRPPGRPAGWTGRARAWAARRAARRAR
jgi:hypothetical protein